MVLISNRQKKGKDWKSVSRRLGVDIDSSDSDANDSDYAINEDEIDNDSDFEEILNDRELNRELEEMYNWEDEQNGRSRVAKQKKAESSPLEEMKARVSGSLFNYIRY